MTRQVDDLKHDLRNLKMVSAAQSDELRDLERNILALNSRIYTTISVCAVVASAVGFGVNIFL